MACERGFYLVILNLLILDPVNKEMKNTKLVATDLDGTFLRDDRTISKSNLEALHQLGELNIIRVAATGRNLRKVNEVIANHVPFDFIVYSSGAGVFNWKEQKHIYSQNIGNETANLLIKYFVERDLNFYAFKPAPENHILWFHRGKEKCREFDKYLTFHNSLANPLSLNEKTENGLCQFLIIIPENEKRFQSLKSEIEMQSNEIRVIRSSSPVTKGFIWVEIFYKSVSKAHGLEQVCNLLGVSQKNTVGIGNDYNDLDLLEFTEHSFLTDNAPSEIKNYFPNIPTNENDAFAFAIQPIFKSVRL